ncbi:Hsp70 family protein, partial [Polymorphospora sp. NPDC051019]|uniref:Hsp70 family protein n=1 Tax=Polymorphospora sp. NPDC051019 TaxID=3155725 RepID=UPI00341FBB31
MVAGLRLGVDLGTSNTVAVLRWPDGRCRPLLFDGSPQMPSAVYASPEGDMVVGRDAVQHSRVHPDRFERNPKRRVDDGTVLLGEVELPVVDLMAAVLRRVHAEAARVGGRQITEAVLTHPVEWGAQRRAMLANAAARAGLHNARLVPEPVAAASYFIAVLRHQLPIGRNLVVYDFGAGTFDATVVRRTPDNLQVLSTDGVADAGGLDVDAAVVEYLGEVFAERDPDGWKRLITPNTSAERRMSQQFWEDVRGAKEMLSRAPSAIVHVPVVDVDVPVGREQLEKFARPVLDRTLLATQNAIRTASVPAAGIAGVFLVGGSSRIPLVATLLHRTLQIAPTTLEQPEMVVAEGSLYVPAAALAVIDPRTYAAPISGPPGGPVAPMSGPPAGPIAPMSGPPAGPIAPMSGPPMSGPPSSGPPYRPMPPHVGHPQHRPAMPQPHFRPGPQQPPVPHPQHRPVPHPQQAPAPPYRPPHVAPPQHPAPPHGQPHPQPQHHPQPQRPVVPPHAQPPHPQQHTPPPQHTQPPHHPAHHPQQRPVVHPPPQHTQQQRPVMPPPVHPQHQRPGPAYPQHQQQQRPVVQPPPQHTQQQRPVMPPPVHPQHQRPGPAYPQHQQQQR